jgi:hypothetical protein
MESFPSNQNKIIDLLPISSAKQLSKKAILDL